MIIRSSKNAVRVINDGYLRHINHAAWSAIPSSARVPFTAQTRQNSGYGFGSYRSELNIKTKEKRRLKRLSARANQAVAWAEAQIAPIDAGKWEITIGVEIHAELDTERKLFSSALTKHSEIPNTNVALNDLAYPGSQPVFQIATVLPAVRAALALGCTVHRKSAFDRKHYFYPDQPAGYQITQFYKPFATDGQVTLSPSYTSEEENVVVRIERVQLEQDTAKSLAGPGGTTLLDFNRVSHPLIEIVSRPDIHSASAAAAYVRKVQEVLKAVGAVTAGMETGALRADVNVSVRRRAQEGEEEAPLGQRTEIKNLSSLRAIQDAVTAESERQIEILEAGGTIASETRGWTIGGAETTLLRVKEGEVDYRYMPDPDVPPLIISDELVQMLRDTLPQLPETIVAEVRERFQVDENTAWLLYDQEDGARLEYLAEVATLAESPIQNQEQQSTIRKLASNFVVHKIPALLKKHKLEWSEDLIPAESLASLVTLVSEGRIHDQNATGLLAKIALDPDSARTITVLDLARNEGMLRSDEEAAKLKSGVGSDSDLIASIAHTVFEANPAMVQDILVKKETKKIHFFAGQVMRELGKMGKAKTVDPKYVSECVHELFWKQYKEKNMFDLL